MQEFITTLFNGLSLSSIILLTSLGLAITFGLMRVINMAHGEFVMIGAYMTYVTQQLFAAFLPSSMRDWYYIAALPLAFAATFLLGTVVGSTAIGGASIFAENYTSATIAKAIVLLLVIVFLQKRPQGLFTIRSRSLYD